MIIHGTEYKDPAFLKKYGYTTRYRLLPSLYGAYGGENVFEYEEVGISTDTLTFEDYIAVRRVSFLVEVLFNSSIFLEIELFLAENNLHFYDFIMFVFGKIEKASEKIQAVFMSFDRESESEMHDSPSELVKFYSDSRNYDNLIAGEIGGNLKYKYKALLLSGLQDEWLDFVFTCLEKFTVGAQSQFGKDEIDSLHSYLTCRLSGVLDEDEVSTTIEKEFSYDMEAWINQKSQDKKLSDYQVNSGINFSFSFDDQQKAERVYLFSQNNSANPIGLANILSAIRPQQRLYRKVEKLS